MIFDVTSSFCASHIYCGIFEIEIYLPENSWMDVNVKGIKDPTQNS